MMRLAKILGDFTTTSDSEKALKNDKDPDNYIGVAVEFDAEVEGQEIEDVLEKNQEEENDYLDGAAAVKANVSDISCIQDRDLDTVDVREIDAYWLQRKISKAFEGTLDPNQK